MANLLTMGVEMTRLTLSENEVTEFTEMVNKFKAYSKPSNRQKELINLYNYSYMNDHIDEIEIKLIKKIILAERKNQLAKEADAQYRKLVKKQNESQVKNNNHIRFETGGALLGLVKKNAMFSDTLSYADILKRLIQLKKIDEYDKNGNWLFGDYLPSPIAPFVASTPATQNQNATNSPLVQALVSPASVAPTPATQNQNAFDGVVPSPHTTKETGQ